MVDEHMHLLLTAGQHRVRRLPRGLSSTR
jgi:hypothetical protein